MVAFRSTDASGRTTGLLFRCVLYSLLALALIIVDKRYDHLGKIRRLLSVVAYPVQIAVASPFEGWHWFRDSVTTRDALRADKTKLEAELRVAQFRLQRYEALEAETQRLRALRDNTAGVTDRFVIGDVMNVDLDAFRERVLGGQGRERRHVCRTGGARFRRRVRPGRARRATHQRGDSGQRCGARHPGADQSQWLAHRGRGHRRDQPAEAALPAHQRRRGRRRLAGDLRLRRRISGRLPGRHDRGGQARSGAIPRRRRRQTRGGTRSFEGTAVRVAQTPGSGVAAAA